MSSKGGNGMAPSKSLSFPDCEFHQPGKRNIGWWVENRTAILKNLSRDIHA